MTINKQRLRELSELYKNELLSNVIPFWMKNSVDKECGGYFTCLTRDGKVFDSDKFIWMQGRQVWLFSMLYNRLEQRQEWLDMAIHGGEFLKKYGHDGKLNWYFSLTRKGEPLVDPYNIFSYAFAAMAFAQLAVATKSQEYADISVRTFEIILSKVDNPEGNWTRSHRGTRSIKYFGLRMILCNLSLELEKVVDQSLLIQTAEKSIREIMEEFYRQDLDIVVENVAKDGALIDTFDGRLVNPGHAIEVMWFIMDLAKRLSNPEIINKANQITLSMLEYGWDKKFGGILHYIDRLGYPTQQLDWDTKLWWVHIECLVTLLKGYQYTGCTENLEWFDTIHQYTWKHFRDEKHGEWFGYLNRQGEIQLSLKGGIWKGCFHLPRGLYQCWKILEKNSQVNS
ncbi:MAG: N-acylglucosamine 2-epimerase [Cyclobacteriaceae bacterium]|nr:MAG: N-acylglucosamine 2-epimerase [Cyclobacteriaceae bacterium]